MAAAWASGGRARAALLAAVLLAALFAGHARGERHQQGDLIVALDGKVSPPALPRHGFAPAGISVSSRLSTVDGSPPPRVRRIELAFAGHSMRFDRADLPTCPARRIRNATDAQALARCGPALVGRGRLEAELLLPHQAPLRVHAHLLDFNSRTGKGGLAILTHAFSSRPPASFVLRFTLHRRAGAFPSVLTAAMPRSVGAWPHLTGFRMSLGRRYRHGGAMHSFLGASCPAPPRFTAGFLSFARIDYSLSDGRSIGDTIVRGCRVRR
jgi:hypothetical protein